MEDINSLPRSKKVTLLNNEPFKSDNAKKYLPEVYDLLSNIVVMSNLSGNNYSYIIDCGYTTKLNKQTLLWDDVFFYSVNRNVGNNSRSLEFRVYYYHEKNKFKFINFSRNICENNVNQFFDSLEDLKKFLKDIF